MKMLSTFAIALAILLTGCKEFIEPSIEKRNVVLLAPANGAESSRYNQKFGQTTSGSRYSDNYLNGAGLQQINLFPGNQMEIRIQEKIMICGYFMEHGTLTPGNSIFR